jgi:ABC-2 type transport system permease protein
VRALALQAQLHEGETFNPELALAGRFDAAFVLVYLLPLFLIALLHDLVSSEWQSGRLATLMALPGAGRRLWLRRAGLRAGLASAAVLLPVLGGAWASGMPAVAVAGVVVAVLAYAAWWTGLALLVALRSGSSVANATALMGCWALLTLVLPTLGNAALARAVPVRQGVELMLGQRQAVHGAWDLPREETMARFFQSHPQWQHTAPLPAGFHWKWYYAFQQLGDESVAPQVASVRPNGWASCCPAWACRRCCTAPLAPTCWRSWPTRTRSLPFTRACAASTTPTCSMKSASRLRT